jgi:hypothetical protein
MSLFATLFLGDCVYVNENCLWYTLTTYTEADVEHMLAPTRAPASLSEEGFA